MSESNEVDAVLVDLETMDVEPTAIVLSVGITGLRFGEDTSPEQLAENGCEWLFKIKQQDRMGRTVSEDTKRWWAEQGDEAKHLFGVSSKKKESIEDLPYLLNEWAREFPLHQYGSVYCRGPNFDFPILENICTSRGVSLPWPFWKIRDIRTFIDSYTGRCTGKIYQFNELMGAHYALVKHNALHDCIIDAVAMDALHTHFYPMMIEKTLSSMMEDPQEILTLSGRTALVNDAVDHHLSRIGVK